MFKVHDKDASKMHFSVCWGAFAQSHTFPLQVCIQRDMQYSKFGLVFDFIFFHKLGLYQVNKTLLNLHFHFHFLWGDLVFSETWGT